MLFFNKPISSALYLLIRHVFHLFPVNLYRESFPGLAPSLRIGESVPTKLSCREPYFLPFGAEFSPPGPSGDPLQSLSCCRVSFAASWPHSFGTSGIRSPVFQSILQTGGIPGPCSSNKVLPSVRAPFCCHTRAFPPPLGKTWLPPCLKSLELPIFYLAFWYWKLLRTTPQLCHFPPSVV